MSPLERTLNFMAGRAEAHSPFARVPIFIMRPRWNDDGTPRDDASFAQIRSRVDAALTGTLKKAGRGGAAITFLMPLGTVKKPNLSGPEMHFTYAARIEENVAINMGPMGTGLSAEELALEVAQLFHHVSLNGLQLIGADEEVLTPIKSNSELDPVAYEVHFRQQGALTAPARVVRPTIAPKSGAAPQTVELTCPTEGAIIHYTLDGSYPSAVNPAAQRYTDPIAIDSACTLYAAATKAGLHQSDLAVAIFS